MSIAHEKEVLKTENLAELINGLQTFLYDSAQRGVPVHEVERAVWREVLRIGRHCLAQFFALHGTGDMGETVVVEDQELHRLEKLHARRYFSIFGVYRLQCLLPMKGLVMKNGQPWLVQDTFDGERPHDPILHGERSTAPPTASTPSRW
jgi:hypothetical protein